MIVTAPRITLRRGIAGTMPWLAALGLALAVSACATKLDMDALGKSISSGIASQVGLEIASVACPQEPRDAKAGDSFECVATPKEGGKLTIAVTEKDDKGNIDWKVEKSEGLLNLSEAEAVIAKGIKEQTQADVTVSCGGKFRAAKAGDTFDCQAASADGTKTPVTIKVKDDAGNIGWSIPGAQNAEAPAGGEGDKPTGDGAKE
jgi:hypothetical protein